MSHDRFGLTHYFQPPKLQGAPIFATFHGTGGTEYDFVDLITETNEDAGILSPLGPESCDGNACFIAKTADGVYDPEYLREGAKRLVQFVNRAAEGYNFDRRDLIWLGYSSGADAVVQVMMNFPSVVNRAILLRPSLVAVPDKLPTFADVYVLLSAGRQDEMVSAENTERLIRVLQLSGAVVELFLHDATHSVTAQDSLQVKKWYSRHADWA